jgi:hypothetical protein
MPKPSLILLLTQGRKILYYHFTLVWLLIIFAGCNTKGDKIITDHSYYYWRTVYELRDVEKEILKKGQVSQLFVRFFDVDVDKNGKPKPIAPIIFKDTILYEIVPVVYITNRTLIYLDGKDIISLAKNMIEKINLICYKAGIKVGEIQIDCDWSQETEKPYFKLLDEIKQLLPNQILSATIRLHQIKFPELTGIPPVDKGTLMVYNVGTLTDFKTKNSIFDDHLILKYLDNLEDYPLELDMAFPVFRQLVLFRNEKFVGVLRKENYFNIDKASTFARLEKTNNFMCLRDTMLANFSVFKGDILRNEDPKLERFYTIEKKILTARKDQKKMTYLYFDLSSENFNHSIHEVPSFPIY